MSVIRMKDSPTFGPMQAYHPEVALRMDESFYGLVVRTGCWHAEGEWGEGGSLGGGEGRGAGASEAWTGGEGRRGRITRWRHDAFVQAKGWGGACTCHRSTCSVERVPRAPRNTVGQLRGGGVQVEKMGEQREPISEEQLKTG